MEAGIEDKLTKIHKKYEKWPIAIEVVDTELGEDLFNPELADIALELAERNGRDRAIVKIHGNEKEELHLMIIAIKENSYIAPHRHVEEEKRENFRILRGQGAVVFFGEDGEIEKQVVIGDGADERKVVLVRPKKWHTFVPLVEGTVILESKKMPSGGYKKETDKEFPKWAPKEGEEESKEYWNNLKLKIAEIAEN